MTSPAFSDTPRPDEVYRLNGWRLTAHARERMGDRGITVDQVAATLRRPDRTEPNLKDDTSRLFIGAGVLLVVDEGTRTVITVGMVGAAGHDEHRHAAPLASVPLREEEAPTPVLAPQRPAQRHTRPVAAVSTIKVDPKLWRACLARAGGNARRLRILSSGEVLILNQPR